MVQSIPSNQHSPLTVFSMPQLAIPKPINPRKLPDVIHIAHEGVLPEWTTGGGGVYIDSLSRLQAKNTDRKISVIIH